MTRAIRFKDRKQTRSRSTAIADLLEGIRFFSYDSAFTVGGGTCGTHDQDLRTGRGWWHDNDEQGQGMIDWQGLEAG